MNDPDKLLARVRKAAKDTPFTVDRADEGFLLTAEVTSPPGARGRRRRETLVHRVLLDPEAGTYRIADRRTPIPESPEEAGKSLLTGFGGTRPAAEAGPDGRRIVDEAAAGLGWTRARTLADQRELVLGLLIGFCVLLALLAFLLLVVL